jgi:zinc protease
MTNNKSIGWIALGVLVTLLVVVSGGRFSLQESLLPTAEAATAKHYTELEFPPLPEVGFPDYESYQLDNGMVVYLIEDHNLPLVSGEAMIHTGSRLEPADHVGLAGITGTVMRTGGTEQHLPVELNRMLEQRAASVETGISTTSGSASFNALSEDLDTVFNLFAEVVRMPAFAPNKLELAKVQKRGSIARRNDDPSKIASREFGRLVYGENSPYARIAEYSTINDISREDVVNFYQTYFRPDNVILGIVGDFDSEKMRSRIANAFGDWTPASEEPAPSVPSASQNREGGLFFVEQPQLSQSYIKMGHLGGKFKNPDFPALDVMNEVLNRFGGRLFDKLRSRQGLAYSVYGIWKPHYDYDGVFVSGGQTRSNSTVPFVQSLTSEIERLRTTPIASEELTDAKESILNSFVFKFEDSSQTLARLMRYEYYGYPEDFIFQYQRGVEATSIEDVQRVAQKHLQPKRILTLVVGNSSEIQPSLSNLGTEVETVDISIPEPTS